MCAEPPDAYDAAASCAVIDGDDERRPGDRQPRDVGRRVAEDAAVQEAADWGQLV